MNLIVTGNPHGYTEALVTYAELGNAPDAGPRCSSGRRMRHQAWWQGSTPNSAQGAEADESTRRGDSVHTNRFPNDGAEPDRTPALPLLQ